MKNYDALKKKVDYEENVPRCGTCVHMKKPDIKPNKQGAATLVPMMCRRHDFPIKASGICKNWKSRSGETLEN